MNVLSQSVDTNEINYRSRVLSSYCCLLDERRLLTWFFFCSSTLQRFLKIVYAVDYSTRIELFTVKLSLSLA